MGSPKALLTLEGETFVRRIVEAMRVSGCDPVVVVTGPEGEDDYARISAEAWEAGAHVVINGDPESEQLESLRIGLRSLARTPAALIVTPVDAPKPSPEIIRAVCTAVEVGAPVAVPTYGGRRGHPIAFSGSVVPQLLGDDLPEGARTLIRRYQDRLALVPVDDAGVLLDIDTPADYDRARGIDG